MDRARYFDKKEGYRMRLLSDFPRVSLGCFPTPLVALPNLSRMFGKRLYLKRDDMTGVGLGGNKVRKLVFLLADALYNRVTNAYKTLFETGVYCGKNERTIRVTVFATERIQHDATGALLSVRDRSTAWGRFLRGSGIKYYPCLLAIFLGKMSFVGPRPERACFYRKFEQYIIGFSKSKSP